MKSNILVSLLYYFFKILFGLSVLALTWSIASEIFTSDGKFNNFFVDNHHAIGYSFPVTVQTKFPDSIVTYASGSHTYYKGQGVILPDKINQDSLKDKIVNNVKIWPYPKPNSLITSTGPKPNLKILVNNSNIISDGYIIVNAKEFWVKALLFTQVYVSHISLIFIFFLLSTIFKKLKVRFDFSKKLISHTRLIGLLLISKEIINTIIVLILSKQIHTITVSSFLNGALIKKGIYTNINPRLDFDLTIFLLGITLIVLSILFYKGYSLRKENDLTI